MRTRGPTSRVPRATVLHFVSTFAPKTDTKWVLQLARHLPKERFRLCVACFYEGGSMARQFEDLGVSTYNLQSPAEGDPRAILRARRLIDEVGCDLVHTHLLRADLLAGAAARWSGVPALVSTIYAMGEYRRDKKRRADRLLDAACSALPTRVVAVALAVADDYIRRTRTDPSRVSVIHTGIDPAPACSAERAQAARRELDVPADAPLILTIARLSYEKGVDTLIDAAALVRQSHPAARVVVIGEGPDRAGLQRRIAEQRLGGVVRLAGFREDVWAYLAAADVVCMPSKSEGMPNALLEAMAAGRPIVATAVGGIPEAIRSEQNGLLAPPEDPRGLAAALRRALDDPSAIEWGRAAAATVERDFQARDVAERYAALYCDVLNLRSERSEPAEVHN